MTILDRSIVTPPERALELDEWAEDTIVLPKSVSHIDGPLSFEMSPFVREILRACADPRTRYVTLCASSQVMKTTIMICVGLHAASVWKVNVLHVAPRIDDATEMAVERYIPICEASPLLDAQFTGRKREKTAAAVRFGEVSIKFATAGSAAGLASSARGVVLFDECDKYDEWTGEEASALKLGEERQRIYENALAIYGSTPTTETKYIWKSLRRSTWERFHVPCPHCGEFQALVFGDGSGGPGIYYPKGVHPDKIVDDALAWYQCGACAEKLDAGEVRSAIHAGRWASDRATMVRDDDGLGSAGSPRHRGFHLWAIYSPFLTIHQIAAEFVKSKGLPEEMQNFRNSWQAECWQVRVSEVTDRVLERAEGDYTMKNPPEKAWRLTVGVDVQRRGALVYQWYVVRAWGPRGESWLVTCGETTGWDELTDRVFATYRNARGDPMPLAAVACDAGYETDQVYNWCRMYGAWAAFGRDHSDRPYRMVEEDQADGMSLRKVTHQPSLWKARVHDMIRGGRWKIPADAPEVYRDHMVAEQPHRRLNKKTKKQEVRWELVSEGRPNHCFDAEVLCVVGAEMAGLMEVEVSPHVVEEEEDGPGISVTRQEVY